jgi:hypothetical protein
MEMAIGAKMTTVRSMMEMESMIMPSTNQTRTITKRIIAGGIPVSRKRLLMAVVTPVMASVRE